MITWFIIGITAIISFLAFQNQVLMEKLQFNAARVVHQKQYYRVDPSICEYAGALFLWKVC
jgi:hypothetical protein